MLTSTPDNYTVLSMKYAIYSSKHNAIGSKRYTDLNEAIAAAKQTAKAYNCWTSIKRLAQ